MDYEKMYKEALKRVRRLHDRMLVLSSTDALVASSELEFIFPELAESEDERIKKGIIEIIKAVSGPDCDVYLDEKKQDTSLAWLKSLRPSWKPSKEHLSALLAVFNDPNNIGSQTCQLALTDLYEQLKKL